MATVNRYEGDGTTTSFAVTFPQYSWTSIVVLLDQVEQTTGYVYNSITKSIVFATAPADGVSITLKRLSSTDLLYKFSEGAAFTGVNLDADFNQFASAVEEVNNAVDKYYVDDLLTDEIKARQEADASLQSQITGGTPTLGNQISTVSWHGQTITNSIDVPAGMNAFSVGPQVTIAPGQSVNLGEGSHWSILGNAFEIDDLYNLTANNITTSDGASTVSVATLAGLDGRTTSLETRMTTEEGKTQPINKGGTGATDAAAARTNLGLGTIATQAASAVSIGGGTIAGINDLAVADGGTGASTAAVARSNLGAAASGANTDITSITGSAATLTTPRSIRTNLASTTAVNFDGSTNITPGVTGTLPIANGGTGGATVAAAHAALGQLYSAGVLTVPNGAGTPVKIQAGSSTGTTDASGNLAITYPSAFSTNVLAVIPTNGDSATGDIIMSVQGFSTANLTGFSVHCSGSVSAARRINWIAIGI
ncbi:hypothetical protein [Pantoea phage LIMEzero]|uniref:Tail fiber protein n=1 Tax=Pantoea phage LIMEzero TaxID=943335 RepID=F4N9U9_9CAUD|nr:tail fiber protein [Pantoea phage LIMEzero]CBY88577.1 hypothetical protein [Pantoea phage LIMEzero]